MSFGLKNKNLVKTDEWEGGTSRCSKANLQVISTLCELLVLESGTERYLLPTFETWENSGKIGSLHHQNRIVFEELGATYCLHIS